MKRVLIGVLVAASGVFLLSCGGSSSTTTPPSGLKFRAFVSQDIAAGTTAPGLLIVDAQKDILAIAAAISAGPAPGLMAVSANRQITMVFSASENELDVVNNAKETVNGHVNLPNGTQSMAVTSDATLGFAAVPQAPVAGLTPGEVEVINPTTAALESPVPNCPPTNPLSNCLSGARSIVLSSDNTHLLVFGDQTNAFTMVNLSNIGTTSLPKWVVVSTTQIVPPPGGRAQLDHPVWAVFSQDGSTAFILSCGPECGGTTASITPFTLATSQLGATVPLSGGATYGASFGATVYVVGSAACLAGADPSTCGKLSILNTAGNTEQLIKIVNIPNGYHNRMGVTSDNQVFVGAQNCLTQCLAIYNSNNGNVVIGSDPGPVTGIQPISGRPQVYVVENGEVRNWSTATDRLAPPQHQMDIVGEAVDVKLVD